MPNAKNLAPDKRIYALLVGRSGSGKTCAELSFPGKSYCLDLDKRIKGGLGLQSSREHLHSGEVDFEQYDFADNGFDKLNDRMGFLVTDSKKLKPEYQNIFFDSASALRRGLLKSSEKYTPRNYRMGSTMMYDKPNYGYESKITYEMFFIHFKNVETTNVFLSAHIIPDFDDQGNVVGQRMLGSEKIAAELPGYFDETWHFYVDTTIPSNRRYKCKFRSDIAKTAFTELPDEIDWTGRSFYEVFNGIITGKLDEKGNPKQ